MPVLGQSGDICLSLESGSDCQSATKKSRDLSQIPGRVFFRSNTEFLYFNFYFIYFRNIFIQNRTLLMSTCIGLSHKLTTCRWIVRRFLFRLISPFTGIISPGLTSWTASTEFSSYTKQLVKQHYIYCVLMILRYRRVSNKQWLS